MGRFQNQNKQIQGSLLAAAQCISRLYKGSGTVEKHLSFHQRDRRKRRNLRDGGALGDPEGHRRGVGKRRVFAGHHLPGRQAGPHHIPQTDSRIAGLNKKRQKNLPLFYFFAFWVARTSVRFGTIKAQE